jgi:hypothetical protein
MSLLCLAFNCQPSSAWRVSSGRRCFSTFLNQVIGRNAPQPLLKRCWKHLEEALMVFSRRPSQPPLAIA